MSQVAILNNEKQLSLNDVKMVTRMSSNRNKKEIFEKTYLQKEHEKYLKAQIFPKKDNWDFTGLKITERQYNVHSFHHYTAKFIPQIPQNIIKTYSKRGDIIFDPFLGSGTTIVEGKLLGHPSYGVEINPLSIKIAESKVNMINFEELNNFIKWLSDKIKKPEEKIEDVSLFKGSEQWFRNDVRFAIHDILEEIKELDKNTKNFIEVGLSSHLKGVSNAMMHRTLPTLPKSSVYIDRKHYDREINNETRELNVYSRVLAKLKRMKTALEYLHLHDGNTPAVPILGDSRKLCEYLNNENVEEINTIVTSPPYWNAQNYQELHSLSIKLFKLEEPDLGEIGRDKKAYMEDMEKVINQLSQITKGTFAFVIGEDTNGDNFHEQLFDMILSQGFNKHKSIRRELSNQVGFTKSISHEWVYIFKK